MKKVTQIMIATLVALITTSIIVVKNEPAVPTQATANKKVWFKTIQISDGITVEFEYGSRLQVFVEGKKELIRQMLHVIDHSILKAMGKNQLVSEKDIRIKVVTPVWISLARSRETTLANCKKPNGICMATGQKVCIKPSLCRQKVFQVFTQKA